MTWNPLSDRARPYFYLSAVSRLFLAELPFCGLLFGGLGFMVKNWMLAGAVAGSLALLFLLRAVIWPTLTYRRWQWMLRSGDLLITHGVLITTTVGIPTHRIQHVDLQVGPIERMFGLTGVSIHTAANVGAVGFVPALEPETAEWLRDHLLASSGDDGV